jgi:transposase
MTTAAARTDQNTSVSSILHLAFELSLKNWKLGFSTGFGQKARQRNIPAGNLTALKDEISKARKRFGLADTVPVVSCYEAGREGYWLHRHLVEQGIQNVIVDSASIEVNRRARRAKSDKLDLDKLLTMLIRYHLGERKVWKVLHVPSLEAEDNRNPHRELQELKRERTRQVNRIKGLLATQGIRMTGRNHIATDLERLRLWDGRPLSDCLKRRLERLYARIDFLDEQIDEIRQQRAEQLMYTNTAEVKKVRQLMLLKGIGPNSAWIFGMEFFNWRKFRNRREVGASAGLTPSPYQSGEMSRDRGISKAGNRFIRGIIVQNAWAWLRFQPESALTKWYEKRFAPGGSRLRRIGIVALSRKLLIALWRYVEFGEIPEGAVLKG